MRVVGILIGKLIVLVLYRVRIAVGGAIGKNLLLNTHWLKERVAYLLIAEMGGSVEVVEQIDTY